MATKNLARTVIEGGRAGFNKIDRRLANASDRAAEHRLSRELVIRKELDDVVYPLRKGVGRIHDDKLGASYRWLESQVGRPWNKIRGELVARFDARTTAGRHVLFCHMLRDLDRKGRLWAYPRTFHLDRHGNLRCTLGGPRFRRIEDL